MEFNNIFMCSCCGEKFANEHWSGGFIEHMNGVRNIEVQVSRRDSGEYSSKDFFLESVGLNENPCNVVDHEIGTAVSLFNCFIKALGIMGRYDLMKELIDSRDSLEAEFDIMQAKIDKL